MTVKPPGLRPGRSASRELTEVTRLTGPAASIQAGSRIAPMPPIMITVSTMPGDSVAGQPLIMLEAMKMQHAVLAPGDGVVAEVRVKDGEQVAAGPGARGAGGGSDGDKRCQLISAP